MMPASPTDPDIPRGGGEGRVRPDALGVVATRGENSGSATVTATLLPNQANEADWCLDESSMPG